MLIGTSIASHSLEERIRSHLVSDSEVAFRDVLSSFADKEQLARLLADLPDVAESMDTLATIASTMALDSIEYEVMVEFHQSLYQQLTESTGFRDLLLIDEDGDILLTALRGSDFLANLETGELSESELGKLFRRIRRSGGYGSSRIDDYTPAGEPVVFFMAPVFTMEGERLGFLAAQRTLKQVIESVDFGTSTSYRTRELVVGFTAANGYTVYASKPNSSVPRVLHIGKDEDRALAVKSAFAVGNGAGDSIDYKGDSVLASWMRIPQTDLALVTKVELEEVYAPVRRLQLASLGVVGGSLILTVLVASWLSNSITAPIRKLREAVAEIRDGDATMRIQSRSTDEIGAVVDTLNSTLDQLQEQIEAGRQLHLEIDHRKQIEEELREANRAREEFLAVISHELRTPLNPVMGFTDLLLDATEDPTSREALRTIKRSSERLLGIIDDLLLFIQLGKKRYASPSSRFLPEVLLEESIETLKRRMPEAAHREFKVTGGPQDGDESATHLFGHTRDIAIVLSKLLDNAVKFAPEGEIEVHYALVDNANRNGQTIVVTVRDQGPGIAPEKSNRLFQAFAQMDYSSTRHHEGLGMGLALCNRILRALGGSIEHDTTWTQGAAFRFTVPIFREDSPALRPSSDPIIFGRLRSRRPAIGKVLVAEDNLNSRRVLQSMLELAQLKVSTARTGSEAVKFAGQERFDLILMDLSMPDMDGLSATRKILAEGALNADTPVVACTAHVGPEFKERCQACGISGFLEKPLNKRELYQILADLSLLSQALVQKLTT